MLANEGPQIIPWNDASLRYSGDTAQQAKYLQTMSAGVSRQMLRGREGRRAYKDRYFEKE